ncbi:MAG: hypothetical protein J7M30_13835 [Deltaproteobacteria bacterium]|nr:hypothetical protein [Deltaproteobacteria bacterium]
MFKSTEKGISTPIVIIIIILCALLVGGIVAWQYLGMPKQEEEIPEAKPPEEVAPADETGNWKTYRNEEDGYELKYPSSWYVYEQPEYIYEYPGAGTEPAMTFITTFAMEEMEENEYYTPTGNYGVMYIVKIDESVEELLEPTKEGTLEGPLAGAKAPTEQINVGGMTGYKSYRPLIRDGREEGIDVAYLFPAKKSQASFVCNGIFRGVDKEIYEEYAKEADQILSTFMFLE